MKLVLDTNVLVSALLSPNRPAALVLQRIWTGTDAAVVDDRILTEYDDVLHRPKFAFPELDVKLILDLFRRFRVVRPKSIASLSLPDPDDLPFVELALAESAAALVTGNARHFPQALLGDVRVLTPRQFLNEFGTESS